MMILHSRNLLCVAALCATACGRATPTTAAPRPSPAPSGPVGAIAPAESAAPAVAPGVLPPPATTDCLPSRDGYLRVRMRGDSNQDIDWRDADMQCDGGPRPGQQGVRLTFAGPGHRGAHSLRFVFGIAAAPGVRAAHNVPTNVTVIFEGQKRLYSTAGDGRCALDEYRVQPLAAPGAAHLQRVSARGFCTAPATAIPGNSALLLSRFDFAGVMAEDAGPDAAGAHETATDAATAKHP